METLIRATVHILDSRAVLRVDAGFYMSPVKTPWQGTILYRDSRGPLLKS